ncbi:SRPBCC family protein [Peribacillus sp. SCS-37]|uniref:SRPBCC family protein n=1 Tax=Paraperibacillus esterisolvens TaxID=3115296 RepID=UPI0039068F42
MKNDLPEIRKTIVLKATIEKVWRAVSTSAGLAAWWMDNTMEPVLGHEFVLHTGQFGDSPCKITQLEPPNRIGFDWDKEWHLTFELKETEEGETEFTLIHSGWNADKLKIREIMDGGWEKIVNEKLPAYLEA